MRSRLKNFWIVTLTGLLLGYVIGVTGPAEATRIVPGRPMADFCDNKAGTQTILDITTGHRFRVVHVTQDGRRICRPINR